MKDPKNSEKSLQLENLHLEQLVAEKTEELSSANEELLAQYEELLAAQEQLTHHAKVQTVMREIAEAAIVADSLDDFFPSVHHRMQRVLNADYIYITLLDKQKHQLFRPYLVDGISNVPQTRALGKGWTEYVMKTGKSLHINREVLNRLMQSGEIDMSIAHFHEWIGAPLLDSDGQSFGVIALFTTDPSQEFVPEDLSLLELVATQISLAIQRKKTEAALQESENRYRAIIQQAPEAVIICDPVSGEVLEANLRFAEKFGYNLPAGDSLNIFDFAVDQRANVETILQGALERGYLPLQRRIMRHKSGANVPVERTAALVHYQGHRLLVQFFRDISAQVRREEELRQDIELAGRVQSELLKGVQPSKHLTVTTLYQPKGYVGGDLYFMDWRYDGTVLRGYLLDMTGHGLSTALHTASMHVLLREVNELDLPLPEQMRWLNQRASQYFDENTFAGAVGFEIDLQTRQLSWCCAGMPLVWLETNDKQGLLSCPGLYLGINTQETYELHMAEMAVGDACCFMTDGFSRLLINESEPLPQHHDQVLQLLQRLATDPNCRDDATAVCIRVNSLPVQSVNRNGWPRVFRINGYGDLQRLKGEVAKILAEATGKAHSMQEVAVQEALANAMECRDGIARQHRARLWINKFGRWLVVRVKTTRIGFAGNALLRRLRSHPEEMFAYGEDAGMGRGIPIMLSTTDRMTYNNDGTEVMLAWKLG